MLYPLMILETEPQPIAQRGQAATISTHVCIVYESEAEQFSAGAAFLREGLDRNEKCLYIASENRLGTVLDAMRVAGIETDSKVRHGRLVLATDRTTLARYPDPQPGWMIGLLKRAIDGAVEEGYAGLRVICEMGWALACEGMSERVLEYEERLNSHLEGYPLALMCQYDQRRFPAEIIARVIRHHPEVVHEGMLCRNMYYIPTVERLSSEPHALKVQRLLSNILGREQARLELERLRAETQRSGNGE